tara:strand:- start:1188 stop:1322 length:135 start_codon:yes stop_codon:yes gene_type:complete
MNIELLAQPARLAQLSIHGGWAGLAGWAEITPPFMETTYKGRNW